MKQLLRELESSISFLYVLPAWRGRYSCVGSGILVGAAHLRSHDLLCDPRTVPARLLGPRDLRAPILQRVPSPSPGALPSGRTCLSHVCCMGRWILCLWASWDAHLQNNARKKLQYVSLFMLPKRSSPICLQMQDIGVAGHAQSICYLLMTASRMDLGAVPGQSPNSG